MFAAPYPLLAKDARNEAPRPVSPFLGKTLFTKEALCPEESKGWKRGQKRKIAGEKTTRKIRK
jgi:hypothetical protein